MKLFPTFNLAINCSAEALLDRGYRVHSHNWQGVDISKKPEAEMFELLNWTFQVPLHGIEMLMHWREDIGPNTPWSDDHFLERIGGEPLNPGEQWKNWPYALSADRFRTEQERFSHTYMERFWPKHAGANFPGSTGIEPLRGIRYEYGDLNDLVEHLAKDPLSRQAYLPIWFPEDGTCPGRKPCTLGYWFIQRNGYFHMSYPIRSCDIVRHFRDDCYLAVRLLLWILDRLREKDYNTWGTVRPGLYTMWIGSLHCFQGDVSVLKKWLGRS